MLLDGTGWSWMVSDGLGWYWMVLDGSGLDGIGKLESLKMEN
jgi:hypothetical protein